MTFKQMLSAERVTWKRAWRQQKPVWCSLVCYSWVYWHELSAEPRFNTEGKMSLIKRILFEICDGVLDIICEQYARQQREATCSTDVGKLEMFDQRAWGGARHKARETGARLQTFSTKTSSIREQPSNHLETSFNQKWLTGISEPRGYEWAFCSSD